MIEPIRLEFDVACSPQRAFDLWTQRSASWWPPEHTVTADPSVQVLFEARLGGRILERTSSGQEVEWGEVTVWEPPGRLGYLWYIRVDRSDATEVEIRFNARPSGGTRVEIEHRGWDNLGGKGPSWRRVNRTGWNSVLPVYVDQCNRQNT